MINFKKFAIIYLLAAGSPIVLHAATYSGITVTPGMLPKEVIVPIPIDITTDQFKARLKSGGTLTLDGNELVLAKADPASKSVAFMALDRLELLHGAKIITNGNLLVIFTNTVASDHGSIVSFEGAGIKAQSGGLVSGAGQNGNGGEPGLSGGVVSIHVVQNVEGQLNVDLRGQSGGDGSDGQKGAMGGQGSKGDDAQDGPGGWLTPGWCKRGGGPGGAGHQGYAGGGSGPGGPGGDGGYFELTNVGATALPSSSYSFSASGGVPGKVGTPGPGGDGGPGGPGGSGSTWCGGGSGGPQGPIGTAGSAPTAPRSGAPGNVVAKNLDIEVMVRTAVATIPDNQQGKVLTPAVH